MEKYRENTLLGCSFWFDNISEAFATAPAKQFLPTQLPSPFDPNFLLVPRPAVRETRRWYRRAQNGRAWPPPRRSPSVKASRVKAEDLDSFLPWLREHGKICEFPGKRKIQGESIAEILPLSSSVKTV